jgi:hypothetical protein
LRKRPHSLRRKKIKQKVRKVGLLAVKVMRRYYFHIRNGPLYSPDKKGCELQCLEQARELATSVLVELARNTLPGALAHEMVIEVNEDDREPALRVTLRFEVERLAPVDSEAANASSPSG